MAEAGDRTSARLEKHFNADSKEFWKAWTDSDMILLWFGSYLKIDGNKFLFVSRPQLRDKNRPIRFPRARYKSA